jgi:sarcosine oxidase
MAHFDVVVCGLGATGSATVLHLANRGLRVLGLERFAPGHDRGSSHGGTRIIRLGYFEHPSYVPLLRRAYELWRELAGAWGKPLLHVRGIVEIGHPDGRLVSGTLASSRLHALPHEVLTASQLARSYPAFKLPPNYVAVHQPDGGFLEVEPSIEASISLAKAAGAEIRGSTRVLAIEPRAGMVRVATDAGPIDAGTAIVTVGAWMSSLLPELSPQLRVTRQVTGWFAASNPKLFPAGTFPVFMIESRHGIHYGVPPHADAALKVAKHHHRDQAVDPDGYDRTVSRDDETVIRAAIREYIPAADGPLIAAKTCLYTMTRDGDFLIDRLPGHGNIIIASACSGHGFKFAPVVGEILADLATAGGTRHDISRFLLSRFG